MLILVSCVPSATQSSAQCGANQSFSNITRSCYSIVEVRKVPVGTLSNDSILQETSKQITLTYTDVNKDSAISCKASGVTSELESISPFYFDGRLATALDLSFSAASALSTRLTLIGFVNKVAIADKITLMTVNRNLIKNSFVQQVILDNLTSYNQNLLDLFVLADLVKTNPALYPNEYVLFNQASTKLTDFLPYIDSMNNHCGCSGGICSTYIISKIRKNGNAGFNYTVTDKDGESAAKNVAIAITPLAYSLAPQYAPTAQGSATPYSIDESPIGTTSLTPTAFQLIHSYGDYFAGLLSSNITYSVPRNNLAANTVKGGKVTCSSTGLCTYTPPNGDINSLSPMAYTAVAATGSLGTIALTARAVGTLGNNITLNFYDLHANNLFVDSHSSSIENFGLVNGNLNDGYIRVVGNTINVFFNSGITTFNQVKNLLDTDEKASKLVSTVGADVSTVFPTAITLTGGQDDYDKFTYTINNGLLDSTAIEALIRINPIDDAPVNPTQYPSYYAPQVLSQAVVTAMDEDTITPQLITLPYFDVDRLPGESLSCAITFTAGLQLAIPTVPLCGCDLTTGLCKVNILPIANFAGTGSLDYVITSNGKSTSSIPAMLVNVPINTINDFPFTVGTTLVTTNLTTGASITTSTTENILPAPATSSVVGNVATITSPLLPISILESSDTEEQSATLTLLTTPGGGADESLQTVSIASLASSDTSILTVTQGVGNSIIITPVRNKSSLTPIDISITLQDNVLSGVNTSIQKIAVTIKPVNDYPFITTSTCAFNTISNTTAYCKNSSNIKVNCVGSSNPVGQITPSLIGVLYWDAANSRCYKSTVANDVSAWLDQEMTPSKAETNEGGVAQIELTVDEDKGSTTNEDTQGIKLLNITSDNPSILPVANISTFYDLNDNGVSDTSESRLIGNTLEPVGNLVMDSKLHKLYLKLSPVVGMSGNANITVTMVDDGFMPDGITPDPKQISKTFSLIVHPIAALHGGWANISASGIKTDKFGAPVTIADMKCNYNKTTDSKACTDASGVLIDCVGTASPHSVIIPKAENIIFKDTANNKCYRSQSPPDKFSWIEMNTSCPVTRLASNNNWIVSTSAVAPIVDPPIPTSIGQFYYNPTSKVCYISTTIDSVAKPLIADRWSPYVPTNVTLEWNTFNLTGSGADSSVQIAGWNIYRREIGLDYNYINGFLKDVNSTAEMSVANPTARKFVDTTAIAGKVYFYTVRPVDNTIRKMATYTPELYSEVRVLAPPENYSFVHRWTINQEICNSMNMTTSTANKVDSTHNYRCPYTGPGETIIAGVHYYDYGKDLLVDISESGCPYSDATVLGCGSNGCIGMGAPTSTVIDGTVYYDRSSGICSVRTAGAWIRYNGTQAILNSNSALNPALTNITALEAGLSCQNRLAPALPVPGEAVLSTVSLPEKKDFMAYSAHPIGMTDSAISNLEQGFSLDAISGCNGSNASGLIGYTDSTIPSSSYMYSLAGSASSTIRSVITGSVVLDRIFASTQSCLSRSGIQDVYGNVAEWVRDGMTCTSTGSASADPYTCMAETGLTKTAMGSYNFGTVNTSILPATSVAPGTYGFDGVTGPFYDKNSTIVGPDSLDGFMTEWNYVDRLFNAGNFSFPLGLPINTEISTRITPAPTATLLDVGAGITSTQLHSDGIIVNGDNLVYSTGTASQSATTTITGVGTSWTAAMVGGDFVYADGTSAGKVISVVSTTSLTVDAAFVFTKPSQGYTISAPGHFAVGGSYLSGLRSGRYTMELVPDTNNTRKDIGFRCVIPVSSYGPDTIHTYPY